MLGLRRQKGIDLGSVLQEPRACERNIPSGLRKSLKAEVLFYHWILIIQLGLYSTPASELEHPSDEEGEWLGQGEIWGWRSGLTGLSIELEKWAVFGGENVHVVHCWVSRFLGRRAGRMDGAWGAHWSSVLVAEICWQRQRARGKGQEAGEGTWFSQLPRKEEDTSIHP